MPRHATTSERCAMQAYKAVELWRSGARQDVDNWLSGSQLKLLYVYEAFHDISPGEAHAFMLDMLSRRKQFRRSHTTPTTMRV